MEVVIHKMPIVSTFDPPPGYEVARVVGPCWGITVRSRSVVGTTCASCQTFFGGEITMFTELANSSRNEAMSRLERHATQMGANCVLGFRFDSSDLMQSTNEIVAYGTAVVVTPVAQPAVPAPGRSAAAHHAPAHQPAAAPAAPPAAPQYPAAPPAGQ